MIMSDNYTCDNCGEEFDSERGLHIHIGQVHGDDEKQESNNESEEVEEASEESNRDFPIDERRLQIPVELALFSVFVLGVAVGLSTGLLAAGSGLSLDAPGAINGDNGDSSPSGDGSSSGSSETVDLSNLETKGEPVLGEEDAPVTMVVYEDFQCPFCQRFETGAMAKVNAEYVESGQVKVIWKDFPLPSLGHDWAEPSAETMECVYRQDNDAFWSVKELIFQNQDSISTDNVQDQIISWASDEGVSEDAVRTCLENESPMDEVNGDKAEGRNFDTVVQTPQGPSQFVSGTPSSVIYGEGDETGEPLVGAQPFSAVQSVIESKLNS
ncbi:MAG: hypothetical protein BRC30_01795 [Nanohaloarchaea archaeon SW_7_46_7]|nr:MAG: hypothetical protein BRC30_01795 [Nanohaloarchaea archaeon SW_7_46_7]